MFKKILFSVAAIGLFAVGQNVQAASIADAGISKEKVSQIEQTVNNAVKHYVPKNQLRNFPTTPGVVQDVEDGLYQIRFKDAPFYITTNAGRSYNGNSIHSWTHKYDASFVFYIKNVGNGEVVILDTLNLRAVEVGGSTAFNGSKIQLWDLNVNMPTMRWTIQEAPIVHTAEIDSVQIVNVNSNLAIDAMGGHVVSGNYFHAWQKLNISNQKFLLEKLTI